MDRVLKPKDMSKLLGVSVKTLQRWDTCGKLPAHRNLNGRRYYTEADYLAAIGEATSPEKRNVAYARVSSAGQKDDLNRQIAFLREYVNASGVILDDVYSDVGSGLNYKRKNWNRLLFDEVLHGKVGTIYVTYRDRFVRFGFGWYEELCNRYGAKVVVVNNPDTSPQRELVDDLISIIHVFSCRVYGLRKYERGLSDDKGLQDRD